MKRDYVRGKGGSVRGEEDREGECVMGECVRGENGECVMGECVGERMASV